MARSFPADPRQKALFAGKSSQRPIRPQKSTRASPPRELGGGRPPAGVVIGQQTRKSKSLRGRGGTHLMTVMVNQTADRRRLSRRFSSGANGGFRIIFGRNRRLGGSKSPRQHWGCGRNERSGQGDSVEIGGAAREKGVHALESRKAGVGAARQSVTVSVIVSVTMKIQELSLFCNPLSF